MQLPIKTEGQGAPSFVAGGFEPVLKDRRTGEVKVDDSTGQTMFAVHLMVFFAGQPKPDVWTVRVVGEPKGVQQGVPVKVVDLVATDWEFQSEQGLRHGISLKALAVEPVAASSGSSKAAA